MKEKSSYDYLTEEERDALFTFREFAIEKIGDAVGNFINCLDLSHRRIEIKVDLNCFEPFLIIKFCKK